MKTSERSSRNSYVRSFARGLSVIRSFTPDSPLQTVSQVATMTGLDRAGARRMLHTLEALGYVHHEGAKFQLTPRVLDLANIYLTSAPLWKIVDESCSAFVLDNTEIVMVVRVPVRKIMTLNLTIGSRLPAYCTSAGRILLGGLSREGFDQALRESNITKRTKRTVTSVPELKRIILREHDRGWSLINQEFEEGICSMSVPIVDRSGRITAALNVTASLNRKTPRKMISTVLPRLKQAALEINSLLST
jgi:IclR family pca regulon transcriptional regulator